MSCYKKQIAPLTLDVHAEVMDYSAQQLVVSVKAQAAPTRRRSQTGEPTDLGLMTTTSVILVTLLMVTISGREKCN